MLDRLLATLKKADLVSIDDQPVTSMWTLHDRSGQPDNQVLNVVWTDGSTVCKDILTEGGIMEGRFTDDGKFIAANYEGDPTVLRFFSMQHCIPTTFLFRSDLEGLGYVFAPDGEGHTWKLGEAGEVLRCATLGKAVGEARADALGRFELHQCDNCGKVLASENLVTAKNLGMRSSPGGVIPSGECPDCGALCYSYS